MTTTISNRLAKCMLTNLVCATVRSTHRKFGLICYEKTRKNHKNNMARNYTQRICDCKRALKDVPDPKDPRCPKPCEGRRKKKKGVLHNIKLKIIEGGTNFGTPFQRLLNKPAKVKTPPPPPPPELPPSKQLPMPNLGRRVQVTVLGADTAVGQYISLMLKQCPQIKKLKLFQAREQDCLEPPGNITSPDRDIQNIVQDLHHIDTSVRVEAYSSRCAGDLESSLQNTDIVLMLQCGYSTMTMPYEKRFEFQAPLVKQYTDAISLECPGAMILVCITPVDCMVPLVAEVMKETNVYDPRKIIGSMAVPEMRATTLAARALGLEPRYIRVPCVGGTEGDSLVPLFSKAVDYFDFAKNNSDLLTDTVRGASVSMARCPKCCIKNADLSEAHAQARLVTRVAHALLCQDIPRITGFVETDACEVISPVKFIANSVELNGSGICRNLGLPALSEIEMKHVHVALKELDQKKLLVNDWFCRYRCSKVSFDKRKTTNWFTPRGYNCFTDCAYASL